MLQLEVGILTLFFNLLFTLLKKCVKLFLRIMKNNKSKQNQLFKKQFENVTCLIMYLLTKT